MDFKGNIICVLVICLSCLVGESIQDIPSDCKDAINAGCSNDLGTINTPTKVYSKITGMANYKQQVDAFCEHADEDNKNVATDLFTCVKTALSEHADCKSDDYSKAWVQIMDRNKFEQGIDYMCDNRKDLARAPSVVEALMRFPVFLKAFIDCSTAVVDTAPTTGSSTESFVKYICKMTIAKGASLQCQYTLDNFKVMGNRNEYALYHMRMFYKTLYGDTCADFFPSSAKSLQSSVVTLTLVTALVYYFLP